MALLSLLCALEQENLRDLYVIKYKILYFDLSMDQQLGVL